MLRSAVAVFQIMALLVTSLVFPTPPAQAFGYDGRGSAVRAVRGAVFEDYTRYDVRGNLVEKKAAHGGVVTMEYDEWDRLIRQVDGKASGSITPPGGHFEELAEAAEVKRGFDTLGNLRVEERDQAGLGRVRTTYEYNQRQQLKRVFTSHVASPDTSSPGGIEAGGTLPPFPSGSLVLQEERTYDPTTGLLTAITSGAGTRTEYFHDKAGRIRGMKTTNGSTAGALPSDPPGLAEQNYDRMGRVVRTTDGDQAVWLGEYDDWGRMWKETLPTGAVVIRTFDDAGNPTSEKTFDGAPAPGGTNLLSFTESKFNSFGALEEVKEYFEQGSARSRTTRNTYDSAGRLVAVESGETGGPMRIDRRVEYEPFGGRTLREIDAVGNTVEYEYDRLPGWPSGVVVPSPWPLRVVSRETVPGLGTSLITTNFVEYRRDVLGRVLDEKHQDGSIISTVYDQAGRILSATTGAGTPYALTSRTFYDSRGLVREIRRPAGRKVLLAYDLDGRLLRKRTTIDPAARAGSSAPAFEDTDAIYQPLTGRLLETRYPDGTRERYGYNADDTLKTHEMRSGILVDFAYSPSNQPLSRVPRAPVTPVGTVPRLDGGDRMSYDRLSRPILLERLDAGAQSNPEARLAYPTYDLLSRPASEVSVSGSLDRSYDVFDNPSSVTLPLGIGRNATGFSGYGRSFDTLDRITRLCANPQGCASYQGTLGAKWAWGGTGRLYGTTHEGPLATTHRYSYVASGYGAQPPPSGSVVPSMRLGTLQIGSYQGSDPLADAREALQETWGQLDYGYREGDLRKAGRQVEDARIGTARSANNLSLFASQGATWSLDGGARLQTATSGRGAVTGAPASGIGAAFETFGFDFGEGDELKTRTRQGGLDTLESDAQGRPTKISGAAITYDAEGHRLSDDRNLYEWTWRGELASITVKPTAPTPYAGHRVTFTYDALGRLIKRRHEDSQQAHVETRRYLWDGAALLTEASYGEDVIQTGQALPGPMKWRKSYVPGASGMDDSVQMRLESFDPPRPEELVSVLRDELGTVTALVAERAGADPRAPPVLVRYLYDPFGNAHVELGPELLQTAHDSALTALTVPAVAEQTAGPTSAPGGIRVLLTSPADPQTLSGLQLQKLETGTWRTLGSTEVAIGYDPDRPEQALVLPLQGLERGGIYRIRVTAALKDASGRPAPQGNLTPTEITAIVPMTGPVDTFDQRVALPYDSVRAASEAVAGAFPGGQALLYQGLWTDPVTGLAYARARWYDAQSAAFLSPDPQADKDSPNQYAFVAGMPQEFTDPTGHGITDWLQEKLKPAATWAGDAAGSLAYLAATSFGSSHETAKIIAAGTRGLVESAVENLPQIAATAAALATSAVCPPCAVGLWAMGVGLTVSSAMQAYADRSAAGQSKGQAIFGSILDATGVSGVAAVVANVDLATGQDLGLTGEERAYRAGSFAGSAAVNIAMGAAGAHIYRKVGSRKDVKSSASREPAPDPPGGCPVPRGSSFVAGTLVATATGHRVIEEVEPGDQIWAQDPVTGESRLQPVLEKTWRVTDEVVVLKVNGEEIRTTKEHPFRVFGVGWLPAKSLVVGSLLLALTGEMVPVEGVEIRGETRPVFNFEVAEDHTFFVSHGAFLVHNATAQCTGQKGEVHFVAQLQKAGYTDIVQIQNPSGHGIDIVARNGMGELRFFEVRAQVDGDTPVSLRLKVASRPLYRLGWSGQSTAMNSGPVPHRPFAQRPRNYLMRSRREPQLWGMWREYGYLLPAHPR